MLFLDGGFGTMLQARGLPPGVDPTEWNVTHPEDVAAVHAAYAAAGSDVVLANTFGATRVKYHGAPPLADAVAAAVRNARASGAKRVALDVGPTGKLLRPAGDFEFEAAYEAFAEEVRLGAAAGADLVMVETMGDTLELKAAVLAAKENCSLPVWATVALGEDGKLLTGGCVESVAALLEGLRVDAYGFNCGLGPDRMLPFVERLAKCSTKPIIVKPNAGMPRIVDGKTVFTVGPEEFAGHVRRLVDAGAAIVGGCCGTTPDHIAAVRRELEGIERPERSVEAQGAVTVVSSGTTVVELKPGEGLVIGERINPTGKKKLREALQRGDTAYVLREAVTQEEAGARILDVNVGVPGLDEAAVLDATVQAVQSVSGLPVQIDTSDPKALERALRHVNGKPLVNSVNGRQASMDAVFPLVAKYGGAIVALTLDENGIPPTAEGRLAIAERILAEGAKYGFTAADFVVDALTLAVSAGKGGARTEAEVTLEAVRLIRERLGVNTVLGVSNVSFGLPNRPAVNNAMYARARQEGLSAAIANPSVIRDEAQPAALAVLDGSDANCAAWIAANVQAAGAAPRPAAVPAGDPGGDLAGAIRHGLREDAARAAEARLAAGAAPMDVIEGGIVPALEDVGRGFEKGTVFLPQLLMAADAAGSAFAVVRRSLAAGSQSAARSGGSPIVLATVKGDVHDIGKNIVRALLENYGFDVIDLGRDVPPEKVLEAVRKSGAKLVGLSALMTTTVGAMAETVALLKRECPDVKTCVGGAVLTQEYADSIGADFYSKDAMNTVRYAESLFAV